MTQTDERRFMRIDDLAHLAGIPTRTIRFYNTEGLLPPPQMQGRIAYYNQEHLLVLNIIKELKEQQSLPLEVIKQLLEIRTHHGDVQMNLALKQRLQRTLISSGQQVRLSKEELVQQAGMTEGRIDELIQQELLFPSQTPEGLTFTGDDLLLLELYQQLEGLGLPLALPALIRFQLRQLVRSELAAFEQHLRPRWQEQQLASDQQTKQFEEMLTLTDSLISVLHRKLIYQL